MRNHLANLASGEWGPLWHPCSGPLSVSGALCADHNCRTPAWLVGNTPSSLTGGWGFKWWRVSLGVQQRWLFIPVAHRLYPLSNDGYLAHPPRFMVPFWSCCSSITTDTAAEVPWNTFSPLFSPCKLQLHHSWTPQCRHNLGFLSLSLRGWTAGRGSEREAMLKGNRSVH